MRLDITDQYYKKYGKKPNKNEVTQKGNISRYTLCTWQNKLPKSVEFLINLSDELGCSVNELVKR